MNRNVKAGMSCLAASYFFSLGIGREVLSPSHTPLYPFRYEGPNAEIFLHARRQPAAYNHTHSDASIFQNRSDSLCKIALVLSFGTRNILELS